MPKKKRPLVLGPDTRKCQPRLRMIANGSPKVNTVRAEQSGSIAVVSQTLLKQVPIKRSESAVPVTKKELPKTVKRGSLKSVPSNILANVFIETLDSVALSKRSFPG